MTILGGARNYVNGLVSFHSGQSDFFDSLTEADLSRIAVVPWAKYFAKSIGRDPVETTLGETLHQVVSHSMHHRGQPGGASVEGIGRNTSFDGLHSLVVGRQTPA